MKSTLAHVRKLTKPNIFTKKAIGFRNWNRSCFSFPDNESQKYGLAPFCPEGTKEFMSYFPLIVEDLTTGLNASQHFEGLEDVVNRFKICLENTVPHGKRVRGLTTIITYKLLEKEENLVAKNIKMANILGWCTELVEGAILIYDDIMDHSLTRRNGLCWHRQKDIGLIAIADAIALNTSAFLILKKYFSHHPHYTHIYEFFHWIMLVTAFGQTMDSTRYNAYDISMTKFKAIAKYKTGYYTFYYPVVLGMYLAKCFDQEILDRKIAPILFEMGELFQIRNDVNDWFGKLEETGKYGTDIEEGRCTWLAAKALESCSYHQKMLFYKNYGKSEKQAVDAISNLYKELKLKEKYDQFEAIFFDSLRKQAKNIPRQYLEVVLVLIDKPMVNGPLPHADFFKDEMAELRAHYAIIAEDLTAAISQYKDFPGLLERFPAMFDYIMPNDNSYFLTTALIPLYSYKAVEEPDKMTADNLKKACIMSWVYRMLEVSQIIVDDIIDKSDVRYNKPVWYKKEGVDLAILDSHYLVTGAYMLLTKYLGNHPCCLNIVNLFMENMFITFISQYMDTANVGVKQFLRFIPLRFDKALYIFEGSVRSALFLANIKDKEIHQLMKKFTIPMSRFFQLQNDFSGVFVNEDTFQRVCPDIISGRNSWLVAMALKMASPAQRRVIEENYGNGDLESAKKVMEIYRELKLDEVHQNRSREFSQEMYEVVESFPKRIPKKPFHDMVQQLVLNKLYS